MSVSYEKWSKLSEEEIAVAISQRIVTREYLNWLGVTGQGQQLKELLK